MATGLILLQFTLHGFHDQCFKPQKCRYNFNFPVLVLLVLSHFIENTRQPHKKVKKSSGFLRRPMTFMKPPTWFKFYFIKVKSIGRLYENFRPSQKKLNCNVPFGTIFKQVHVLSKSYLAMFKNYSKKRSNLAKKEKLILWPIPTLWLRQVSW